MSIVLYHLIFIAELFRCDSFRKWGIRLIRDILNQLFPNGSAIAYSRQFFGKQ